MQSTYDTGGESVGQDIVSKIRVKQGTGRSSSRWLFDVVLVDQVRLAAAPDHLFIVQCIECYCAGQSPR